MTPAMSTPVKSANPSDWSSPLSSPPPSSVTNRLLDFSSQSSPPGPTDDGPSPILTPATPSPQSPPSPLLFNPPETTAGPDNAQPQAASPKHHQQGDEADASATSAQTAALPPPPSPPVATRRSGRVRKRPADDSPADERRTPPKKASPSAAAASKRVKREAARWQPASVLSNKRSPLVNFDLRALLCKPEAWTVLDKDEQAAVLALFPQTDAAMGASADTSTDTNTDRPPIITALANDDNFRHDCARYRSDLEAGFFDKAWLADAFAAHAQRARGVFDAYVVEAFEAKWDIPLPDAYRPASVRSGADKDAKDEKDAKEDKAKEDDQHEEHSAEVAKTETETAQETAAPPDEPVSEAEAQTTPEEPDAAAADAIAEPLVSKDAEGAPAPDDVTLPAEQPPKPRATVNKRTKTERPARRAPRSTPTAKPEKKAPGRVNKRKQASPVAEDKAAKEKAAAFDWEFHDDAETEVSPADANTDTGSDAARKAPRRAPAKRRASSTVAVRGRKKKTTPGPAKSDGDGNGDGNDGDDGDDGNNGDNE